VLVAEVPAPEREQLIDLVTRWARERLSSYKVPTRTWILRRADLPLTATGKVSKRLLRDHLLRPATEPSD
jgi:fatty-acyl-CoA synthase